jgi:hypothetical protein
MRTLLLMQDPAWLALLGPALEDSQNSCAKRPVCQTMTKALPRLEAEAMIYALRQRIRRKRCGANWSGGLGRDGLTKFGFWSTPARLTFVRKSTAAW